VAPQDPGARNQATEGLPTRGKPITQYL